MSFFSRQLPVLGFSEYRFVGIKSHQLEIHFPLAPTMGFNNTPYTTASGYGFQNKTLIL